MPALQMATQCVGPERFRKGFTDSWDQRTIPAIQIKIPGKVRLQLNYGPNGPASSVVTPKRARYCEQYLTRGVDQANS